MADSELRTLAYLVHRSAGDPSWAAPLLGVRSAEEIERALANLRRCRLATRVDGHHEPTELGRRRHWVLHALGHGPQSTSRVADAVGADRSCVYHDLALWEEQGIVESELTRDYEDLRTFCIGCLASSGRFIVITASNAGNHPEPWGTFPPVVRAWWIAGTAEHADRPEGALVLLERIVDVVADFLPPHLAAA